LVGTASAQNILLNPGFEAGSGADAADWGEINGGPSGSTTRSSLMPDTGNWHALMEFDHINNPAAGGAYFIEQVQPVGSINPLVNYDLSFRAKAGSTDFVGVDMFVQILWLDQDASNGGGVQGEMLTSLIERGHQHRATRRTTSSTWTCRTAPTRSCSASSCRPARSTRSRTRCSSTTRTSRRSRRRPVPRSSGSLAWPRCVVAAESDRQVSLAARWFAGGLFFLRRPSE
jgi:hypothetical protein